MFQSFRRGLHVICSSSCLLFNGCWSFIGKLFRDSILVTEGVDGRVKESVWLKKLFLRRCRLDRRLYLVLHGRMFSSSNAGDFANRFGD